MTEDTSTNITVEPSSDTTDSGIDLSVLEETLEFIRPASRWTVAISCCSAPKAER